MEKQTLIEAMFNDEQIEKNLRFLWIVDTAYMWVPNSGYFTTAMLTAICDELYGEAARLQSEGFFDSTFDLVQFKYFLDKAVKNRYPTSNTTYWTGRQYLKMTPLRAFYNHVTFCRDLY